MTTSEARGGSRGGGAPSVYRLSAAHVLRASGPLIILVGLMWIVVAFSDTAGLVRVLLALLTFVVFDLAVCMLIRPPRVLSLSDDGYRISFVRGVGEPAVGWSDVESVQTEMRRDAPTLVFTLSGGRSSAVPLSLLGGRNLEAQRDVHERLNRAHGYRRL